MARLSSLYRAAFVTGASAGLGRAFAEMLLGEGVRVWGTARDPERLAGLAGAPGFSPVVLDLEKPDEAAAAFEAADREAGGFELVVNNAGYGVFGPFHAVDFAVWQRQIDAMLGTTARLSHAALGRMMAAGRGCLVHVASLATEFPLPFMAGYNVAKAGLSALSESLALESRGTGVVVMDFRPGDFRTGFNRSVRRWPGAGADAARLEKAWEVLDRNVNQAPEPKAAAAGLRRALVRRRSGLVRCGSFFQAHAAPFLARFASAHLRRAALVRYFGNL